MAFASGDDLTAAKLNAAVGGVWVDYTPTWLGSGGNPVVNNGSLVGRWTKIGSTVHFRVNLLIGSTTNKGSGAYSFGLPQAAATATGGVATSGGPVWVGSAYGIRTGVSDVIGAFRIASGDTSFRVGVDGGVNIWSHNYPVTWGTSDTLTFYGSYEGQPF